MEKSLKFIFLFSMLAAPVLSAPRPVPQQGPFAVVGNLIRKLQSSFNEGSASVNQPSSNSFSLPIISGSTTTTSTTTTTTPATTTTRVTTPVIRTQTNPFDSINAILDNIGRSNDNSINNNNLGNNLLSTEPPPRNIFEFAFTTTRTPPTTRSPFDLDGINQGINAFFQAFIKTNIQKIFKQGQDQHQITARSDELIPQRPPSFGDIIFNSLFRKQ